MTTDNPQDINNPAQPENTPEELNYQDIHNSDMSDLVAEQHKAEAEWADEWNAPQNKPKEPDTQLPSAPAEDLPASQQASRNAKG